MNPSGRGLLKATSLSVVVAAVLLVTVVLPAEYGLDPLGTGSALGLTGLSRTGPAELTEQSTPFRQDRIAFELTPFESVEYKYRLEAGAAVSFSWRANGEVVFDFHAEPDGAEAGYAESFEQGRASAGDGTYVAPFSGIHGWFWENRGASTVTVTLDASGFFGVATEFRDNDRSERLPPLVVDLD
jgi:hypothetical protein